MAREKPPLIPPPQPIWTKALWALPLIALAAYLFARKSEPPPQPPPAPVVETVDNKALCAEGPGRVEACGKVIDDDGEGAEARSKARVLRAEALFAAGDHDGALADYDALLAVATDDVALLGARAAVFAAKGDRAKEAKDLDAAIRHAPTDGGLYLRRACSLAFVGARAKAEADLKKAGTLGDAKPEPDCAEALARLRAAEAPKAGGKRRK